MNYIDEIFARANIQQICKFLLSGTESVFDEDTYEERLDNSYKKIEKIVIEEFSDNFKKSGKILDAINEHCSVYEKVYTEIGFISGLSVALQISDTLKHIPKNA